LIFAKNAASSIEMPRRDCGSSATTGKNGTIVVSALRARANFGKLLRRVDDERRSLIIEKRGTPKAVLLSIRDYVKLAAPEPEVLRVLGEESERNGTSTLTSREIDKIIKASRSQKPKRQCFPSFW
jgi:prevent-host-death family protein